VLQQTTVLRQRFRGIDLTGVFSKLKDICSSLQSPLQEPTNETTSPRLDKGPTTISLERNLLHDIFQFSMLKFQQRLTKRQQRFTDEDQVIPSMGAFTATERKEWTREPETRDYEKFQELVKVFSTCFRWAIRSPESLIDQIAYLVTDMAYCFRKMIADEGDQSRLTRWEGDIGQLLASESFGSTKLTVNRE